MVKNDVKSEPQIKEEPEYFEIDTSSDRTVKLEMELRTKTGNGHQDKQGLPRRARRRRAKITKTAKDDSNDSNWSD